MYYNFETVFLTSCVPFSGWDNLLRDIPSVLSSSDHLGHPGQTPPTFSSEVFRPVLSFLRNITVRKLKGMSISCVQYIQK